MGAVPFLKLGILLVKQIAKPVAKGIKDQAHQHRLLKTVCGWVGQGQHNISTRVTIAYRGHVAKEIPLLPEEKAVKDGAEFVAEAFIYGVGGGAIIYEFLKSEEKNAQKAAKAKEEKRKELEAISEQLGFLHQRIGQMEVFLEETSRSKPWKRKVFEKSKGEEEMPEFKPLKDLSSSLQASFSSTPPRLVKSEVERAATSSSTIELAAGSEKSERTKKEQQSGDDES
uniref:OPA3-like protein n=1 Tax=Heterosigma akashiwo TaxID=2829 RepID=A0A7S3UX87_HETAK|mmetsp:Transcript_30406/g.52729  ORF Transcript_30406/g.52729 Transcript_30406/m.52729 type:complete len:227 (-) Transcript_30406:35-715(-)